jgi:hypothetical protein
MKMIPAEELENFQLSCDKKSLKAAQHLLFMPDKT